MDSGSSPSMVSTSSTISSARRCLSFEFSDDLLRFKSSFFSLQGIADFEHVFRFVDNDELLARCERLHRAFRSQDAADLCGSLCNIGF